MTFLLRAAEAPAAAGPTRRREHPALALERAILAILSEEPSHGYAILAKLEKRIGGVCGISYGQVYRVLAGLERRGLIVGRAVQVARRPTRRVFDLSEAGRDDVQRWLVEAPARTMFFGIDFYLRLPFLSSLDSETREEVLVQQVRRCREHLAMLLSRCQAARATDSEGLAERLVLEAAILHSKADLEVLERCRAELPLARGGSGGTSPPAGDEA
jgi:DNA-binding PadR family transcriptional regulator